jgi:geranylgeranylglycerol-phosphate geranylgeranyltransferase
MCTFIANDLDDIEKDRVNHPDRPLPSRHLTPTIAGILYFTCLGFGLFATRYFVAEDTAFWYYGLFILSISYGYLVGCFPIFKSPYVALVSSIPIVVIARSFANEPKLYLIAACVFFFTLGREICGDILDRDGDAISYLNKFKPGSLAVLAFSIEGLGMILLGTLVRNVRDVVGLVVMIMTLALAGIYWFREERYRRATLLMKVQLFVGLLFLS